MYNIMNSEPEYSDYSERKQFLKLFCNVALLCYITFEFFLVMIYS